MKLYVVPIRFWEDDAVIKTAENARYEGDQHVYGFCPQYGHGVYFMRRDCFETVEEVQAEIQRRRVVRDAEDEAALDKVIDEIHQMYRLPVPEDLHEQAVQTVDRNRT